MNDYQNILQTKIRKLLSDECEQFTRARHSNKLVKPQSNLDNHKYFYTQRVVEPWNKLSYRMVCAQSLSHLPHQQPRVSHRPEKREEDQVGMCVKLKSTSKEPVCPRVELILKLIIILLILFLGFIKSKPC